MYPLWKLIVGMIFSFLLGVLLTGIVVALWQLYKEERQYKKRQEACKAEIQRLKEDSDKRIGQLQRINEEILEELEKYSYEDGSDYPC